MPSLLLLLTIINYSVASCPNNCNQNGDCDKYSRCHCYATYTGADCSQRNCPFGAAWSDEAIGTDIAHGQAECSNRGICDRKTGNCDCMDGFTGSACERLTCHNRCNEKGICYSMHDLALRTRNSLSARYDYTTIWDADKIQGCYCDYPNFGYDCSLRQCPTGDDPLTTGQKNAVQLVECIASGGSFVLHYNGKPSSWIPFSADAATVRKALLVIPELTDLKVTFSLPKAKACQIHSNIISIEFTEQFGPQSPFVAQGDQVLQSTGGYINVYADGSTSHSDFNGNKRQSVTGTKENDVCAGRGVCDENDGTCSCFNTNGDEYASSNGYGVAGTRGDCGYVLSSTLTSVSSCPGVIQCSGHGVCDTQSYRCYCSEGWSGGDCSERVCPMGRSWFSYPSKDNVAHFNYATCGDMGVCDKTTGKCQCRPGFYGEACEYMACGGGVENPCSGHGTCMSMAQLALWSNKNGDSTLYTYGSDPNNPKTWDYDRVHGCKCDEGFSGYDCSLIDCVSGDDPGTYNDHSEVQLIQCRATSGNFSLSFRQFSTPILPYDITAAQLEAELSALPTIGSARVYFSYEGPPPPGVLEEMPLPRTVSEGAPAWYNFTSGNVSVPVAPPFTYNSTSHTVNYITGSTLCHADGTQIAMVEFTHTHGDLPAIQSNTEFLIDSASTSGFLGSGKIRVLQNGQQVFGIKSIKGTTETDFCNNRGICNQKTGLCECFPAWTSSDGARQGKAGFSGDCGYRNDMLYSSFDSRDPAIAF